MTAQSRGLPGLAGGEHIGITVPDLQLAVDFFVDVIGCDFVFDGGRCPASPSSWAPRSASIPAPA